MDFNPIEPANTSPRSDAPPPPDSAGFEHELSALQALAEAPDFDQDRIWREVDPEPSQAGPSRAAEASDFGNDPIWQHLEPGLVRGGPSQAGPSQAGPSSSAGTGRPELGDFVLQNGRRAKEYWVFTRQTATVDQINMLSSRGVLPSKDTPTTTFTMLGVPHTAEWREEGFICLTPQLDPSHWPAGSGEDSPTG
ncbi:hypothetical protein ACFFWD_03580 [Bradyrhizobium erythrophlei]|uniref:hypothetical protein n=1 Tax=Bradyrhizobium erythrophlei TaxID=1437360 RepID=UPI0035E6A6E9